jgi:glutamyl-tRNA synthetase
MTTLGECVDMLGFLFTDASTFQRDPADTAKLLDADGRAVVRSAHDALAGVDDWQTSAIDDALRAALIEDLGLKPRTAFGAVRVAVTGRRISPPLFESLELLGRDRALARLEDAFAAAEVGGPQE